MGFIGNLLGIGGDATQKTQLLPQSNDASFDQSQGQIMQAIQAYSNENSQYLTSGMDSYKPGIVADLGEPTQTAMYAAMSPNGLSNGAMQQYVSQLDEGMFQTELTSPQSMLDRARAADLFDGI